MYLVSKSKRIRIRILTVCQINKMTYKNTQRHLKRTLWFRSLGGHSEHEFDILNTTITIMSNYLYELYIQAKNTKDYKIIGIRKSQKRRIREFKTTKFGKTLK